MNKELEANTTLSHYRIVSKIGAGGMGEVYRARDSRLDREVAIKLLGELQTQSAHRYVSSASLALVYGALGDKEKAFAWLEKEVAERTRRPTLFSVHPLWHDLRDDPRFADLVRRVGLAKMD